MFSERVFQAALLISLITHGVILAQGGHFQLFSRDKNNKDPKIEISYLKEEKKLSIEKKINPLPKKEPLLQIPPKITLNQNTLPPAINRELRDLLPDQSFAKPTLSTRPDIIAVKKKITFSPIEADDIKNPAYISYQQIVREKIKRSAYQYYTGREKGEITVSFIISQEGYLRDWRLNQDRSNPSVYLREIAIKSLKNAAPFPNFPQGMDWPQSSFNLTIIFEVE